MYIEDFYKPIVTKFFKLLINEVEELKPKLYFYKDSMSFHCYTECGQLDIIGVVMGYKGYEQEEFQKAINWISVKLNLDNHVYGFGKQEQISDWEFIKKYKKNKKVKPKDKILVPYDKNVLNIFQHFYCQSWIEEGISVETMKKYNILYSTCPVLRCLAKSKQKTDCKIASTF